MPGVLPPAAAAAAAALGPYYGLGGAASLNGGPLGLVSSANHSLTPPPNFSGSAGLGLGGRLAHQYLLSLCRCYYLSLSLCTYLQPLSPLNKLPATNDLPCDLKQLSEEATLVSPLL